jgi:AraC-like DNA-binding protein
MNTGEKGVLRHSYAYFHSPSQLAKSMFFYLLCAGHFYCDSNYNVQRNSFRSYLLMYIKTGEGIVTFNSKTLPVKTGDIVLLNCHQPHSYQANKWETLWCHFDGNVSSKFFDLIYNTSGCVFPLHGSQVIPDSLITILETLKNKTVLNESLVSCSIQRMLTELHLIGSKQLYAVTNQTNLDKAITYIQNNYDQKISVRNLALYACMSLYYFSRVFKKSTGYSPHEYITMVRLNRAKILLKATELSIKELAFKVGFNSEANFITCFKKHTTYTPNEFRKMPI